jgi:hypothetical protein
MTITVQRVSGPACRLCLEAGEVTLPAAPATVVVTPEVWAAIEADPALRAQFSTDVPAAPADEE